MIALLLSLMFEGEVQIQIINSIVEGKTPEFPKKTNPHFVRLVASCWNLNPVNRPDIRLICESMKEIIDEHHQQARLESKQEELKSSSPSKPRREGARLSSSVPTPKSKDPNKTRSKRKKSAHSKTKVSGSHSEAVPKLPKEGHSSVHSSELPRDAEEPTSPSASESAKDKSMLCQED